MEERTCPRCNGTGKITYKIVSHWTEDVCPEKDCVNGTIYSGHSRSTLTWAEEGCLRKGV